MELITKDAPKTMTSIELVEIINEVRKAEGKKELRHDHFMAKVEKVLGDGAPKFRDTYIDSQNKERPCFNFPKREAELMVMSESYAVQAKVYDRMTELEGAQPDPLAILPADKRMLVNLLIEQEQIRAKQAEQDAVQAAQAESIKRLEAKQTAFEDGHSFFTVMGFCVMRGVAMVMADMQRLGKAAAAISRDKNIPIDKVRDVRFGMVNSYHESTLDEAFAQIHSGL